MISSILICSEFETLGKITFDFGVRQLFRVYGVNRTILISSVRFLPLNIHEKAFITAIPFFLLWIVNEGIMAFSFAFYDIMVFFIRDMNFRYLSHTIHPWRCVLQ